jgi:hypothetical protein
MIVLDSSLAEWLVGWSSVLVVCCGWLQNPNYPITTLHLPRLSKNTK